LTDSPEIPILSRDSDGAGALEKNLRMPFTARERHVPQVHRSVAVAAWNAALTSTQILPGSYLLKRRTWFIGGLKVFRRWPVIIIAASLHLHLVAQHRVATLELRLSVQGTYKLFPQSFTVLLINTSSAPVKLPTPALSCTNSYNGSVQLQMKFQPLDEHSNLPGFGRGCGGGVYDAPRGSARIDAWKTLQPGESIKLSGAIHELFHDQGSGTYDFWALYEPPELNPAERLILDRSHDDLPDHELTSNHEVFVERP
jgi:hypothetical protein